MFMDSWLCFPHVVGVGGVPEPEWQTHINICTLPPTVSSSSTCSLLLSCVFACNRKPPHTLTTAAGFLVSMTTTRAVHTRACSVWFLSPCNNSQLEDSHTLDFRWEGERAGEERGCCCCAAELVPAAHNKVSTRLSWVAMIHF